MTKSIHEQSDLDESDADDEYDRMRDMLDVHISKFAEEHDLPVGALSPLLLDLAVLTRMADYAMSVEKPSGSGLKLDLDRMHREVDHFVRDCKRHADEFVANSKDALQKAQAELEAEEQETTRKP
jgi:hypothetical protein